MSYRASTCAFKTSNRCRGHRQSQRLLAGGAAGRLLEGTKAAEQGQAATQHRTLQNEDCPCPLRSENEFLLEFNSMIEELASNRALTSVAGANDNFAELEQVSLRQRSHRAQSHKHDADI